MSKPNSSPPRAATSALKTTEVRAVTGGGEAGGGRDRGARDRGAPTRPILIRCAHDGKRQAAQPAPANISSTSPGGSGRANR
ncbi:hypothetical protein tb265_24680 [Gemmatimonadetes bacterium T265]|nr:hypothetical protein tb265_24680 [Gemmatimonadetes bacterium T265]